MVNTVLNASTNSLREVLNLRESEGGANGHSKLKESRRICEDA